MEHGIVIWDMVFWMRIRQFCQLHIIKYMEKKGFLYVTTSHILSSISIISL